MSDVESLREVVRDVLSDAWPTLPEHASRQELPHAPHHLMELAGELGWRHLEEDGAGPAFAAVVLEELGAVLGPGELATAVAAGPLLDAHLRGAGDEPFAISWAPPRWRRDAGAPVLDADGDRQTLTGSVPWVLGTAEDARLLVLADHGGRPVALLVPAHAEGTHLEHVDGSDPTRAFRRWKAIGAPVIAEQVVARDDAALTLAAELTERVDLGLALDALGVARAALDLAVAYAKVREQFGAPIGSFQAVKHRCVDMFVQVQCAQVLVQEAVRRFGRGDPGTVSRAKAAAGDCAAAVTRAALQTHGAIGYTWEHPCHLLVRRAKLDQALGTPAAQARRNAGEALTRALQTYSDDRGRAVWSGSKEGGVADAGVRHG